MRCHSSLLMCATKVAPPVTESIAVGSNRASQPARLASTLAIGVRFALLALAVLADALVIRHRFVGVVTLIASASHPLSRRAPRTEALRREAAGIVGSCVPSAQRTFSLPPSLHGWWFCYSLGFFRFTSPNKEGAGGGQEGPERFHACTTTSHRQVLQNSYRRRNCKTKKKKSHVESLSLCICRRGLTGIRGKHDGGGKRLRTLR